MSNVVNLDEVRGPHVSGPVLCLACGHKWIAVAPVGAVNFECPACRTERGVREGHVYDDEQMLDCGSCEGFAFTLNQDGSAMCMNCGQVYGRVGWQIYTPEGFEMGAKPWYLSRTVLAALVVIAASGAGMDIDKIEAGNVASQLDSIITAVAAMVAIYGRVKATKRVTK